MSKNFKNYLVVWAALLVLFNVIAFVSVGWEGQEKYTASFWIGYVFITLSLLGQLACSYKALKEENLSKLFYNIPIIQTSYAGLISSFIFGGLCMLISPLPYWVGVLLCVIVLALNVFSVMKAVTATEIVERLDTKIKTQTFFIKSLNVDAQTLMARAESEEARAECRKVAEAIRYSDPMSSDALAGVETQITLKFAALSDAVTANDLPALRAAAREVVILVEDRNKKCKLLK